MPMTPSQQWDQRFSSPEYVYGTAPSAFLVEEQAQLTGPLKVLELGAGEGRNAAWLASLGAEVWAVDASEAGLKKAMDLASRHGVADRLHCQTADLTAYDWPKDAFDRVVLIFVHLPPEHRAEIHRQALYALKPGGLLIAEFFRPEQLQHQSGGPKQADLLYEPATLAADFGEGTILQLTEASPVLNEGPLHQGLAATVRVVVRRG